MVAGEVGAGGGAGGDKVRVFGGPRGQVVLGEEGDVGAVGGSLAQRVGAVGKVALDVDILEKC